MAVIPPINKTSFKENSLLISPIMFVKNNTENKITEKAYDKSKILKLSLATLAAAGVTIAAGIALKKWKSISPDAEFIKKRMKKALIKEADFDKRAIKIEQLIPVGRLYYTQDGRLYNGLTYFTEEFDNGYYSKNYHNILNGQQSFTRGLAFLFDKDGKQISHLVTTGGEKSVASITTDKIHLVLDDNNSLLRYKTALKGVKNIKIERGELIEVTATSPNTQKELTDEINMLMNLDKQV